MIRDLFGILVIMNVNVINLVILINIYSDCKCKKKLIDPLADECTENINETSLVKKTLDKSEDRCNFYIIDRALF